MKQELRHTSPFLKAVVGRGLLTSSRAPTIQSRRGHQLWRVKGERAPIAVNRLGCTDNVVADLLSRPTEVNALFKGYQGIDLELLAREQLQDPKVLELRRSNTTSLRLKEHTVPDSDSPLLLDTSLSIPRVIVPYNLRKHVFDAVHSLSHQVKSSQVIFYFCLYPK